MAKLSGRLTWLVSILMHSLQRWQVIGAASVLLAISVAVVFLVKRTPFLAVGWFWYLGTLFPVSGLMQAGAQAMADRYTYFPFIGIAIMVAWGIPLLIKREDTRKKILFPAAIAALVHHGRFYLAAMRLLEKQY